MKLYVWTNFAPDYTCGLAFAIADSVEEAKALVIDDLGVDPSDWGVLAIYPTDCKIARAVYGGG